jgi:hypothetical protein
LVLVSVGENQIRIGCDFLELVAELEPEILIFEEPDQEPDFLFQFMYGTRTQDFWEKNN